MRTTRKIKKFVEFDDNISRGFLEDHGKVKTLVEYADAIIAKHPNKFETVLTIIAKAMVITQDAPAGTHFDWRTVEDFPVQDPLPMRADLFRLFGAILARQEQICTSQSKIIGALYGVERDASLIMSTILASKAALLAPMPPMTVVAAKTPQIAKAQIDTLEVAALCFASLAGISGEMYVYHKIAICSFALALRQFFTPNADAPKIEND